MRRVLIITYYWPPSGGAGVQRWLKFCKYLPEFGWQPIVVTVHPDHATYPVTDDTLSKEVNDRIQVKRTSSKEWFSVYKKVSNKEHVPYAGFANENKKTSLKQKAARFARGNFFIPDPRKGWNQYALKAAREIIVKDRVDVIVTTSPPHSTQLIGLELQKEYEIPWLADLRDPWTDIYYYKQFYPTLLAHRLNLKLEKKILDNADVITTVGASLQSLFQSKINQNPDKIKILTNGYDPEDFSELDHKPLGKFTITYVGTLAESYPTEGLIDGCSRFLKEHQNTTLKFIGTLSDDKKKLLSRLPKENTEFIPYVDHKTAIKYMAESSVLLLIIPEHTDNKGIITGKIFEYIAVGRPVLFLGPIDGDGADILKKAKAGEVIDPMDGEKIFETLTEWKHSLPRLVPNTDFSRKNLTKDLASIFDQLVS